ncbi:hypothetical protein V498_06252 [Pseudogymnoascus sp. VKM F-4517 (FW-2822)]|nr:hypothetical protein V498_06252 [Pseudogymnoascus sp. VKM F-4517 (FW-2822)]
MSRATTLTDTTRGSTLLLAVRGAQAVFALIIMALMVDTTEHPWDAPTEVMYDIFVLAFSVWTLIALIYIGIAPFAFPKAANKYAILVFDSITVILWFFNVASLGDFTSKYCSRSTQQEKKCHEFIATVILGSFNLALFAGTTIAGAFHCWRTRGGNSEPPHAMKAQPAYAGA